MPLRVNFGLWFNKKSASRGWIRSWRNYEINLVPTPCDKASCAKIHVGINASATKKQLVTSFGRDTKIELWVVRFFCVPQARDAQQVVLPTLIFQYQRGQKNVQKR